MQPIEDLLQRGQLVVVDLPELVRQPREILPIELETRVNPEGSRVVILLQALVRGLLVLRFIVILGALHLDLLPGLVKLRQSHRHQINLVVPKRKVPLTLLILLGLLKLLKLPLEANTLYIRKELLLVDLNPGPIGGHDAAHIAPLGQLGHGDINPVFFFYLVICRTAVAHCDYCLLFLNKNGIFYNKIRFHWVLLIIMS